MNDPCPQQPVWGWTLSTDLRSESSVPLTPPSPPTLVSGAGWDTHIWQFSQEVSRFGEGFLFMLILFSFQHWAQLTDELLTSPACPHWGCSSIPSGGRVCLHCFSLYFFLSVFTLLQQVSVSSLLQECQTLRHSFPSTLSNRCYKVFEMFEAIMYEREHGTFWKGEN